jgi:hypothetical protein
MVPGPAGHGDWLGDHGVWRWCDDRVAAFYNAHDEFPLRIFGRPVIEVMNNPQLGAAGDIILCDLSQLVCAEMPGLEADVSFEIQFTTYQTAFRFVRRYDIKSPWTAALTSVDGNYSYSPFVCLQARGT